MARTNPAVEAFLDRNLASPVPAKATIPRTLREPTPDEKQRGVAIAYAPANFAVYRAVIERLRAGERLRMETQHGTFEFSAADFYRAFPGIAASASFQRGADSMPNRCYYVVGPPPAAAAAFRVSG